MTCTQTRLAISAVMDGEEPDIPRDQLRSHLDGCAACQAWQASAEGVTAMARLGFNDAPDLVERVLAAAAPGGSAARHRSLAQGSASAPRQEGAQRVLRWALALSAVAQLILAVPLLFSDLDGAAVHHSREMASFDIAVAVGFLFAAWRPARASALVPVAVALSLCLFVTGMIDVANNTAAVADEVGHLMVVVQAGVLWALGRTGRPAPHAGNAADSLRAAA